MKQFLFGLCVFCLVFSPFWGAFAEDGKELYTYPVQKGKPAVEDVVNVVNIVGLKVVFLEDNLAQMQYKAIEAWDEDMKNMQIIICESIEGDYISIHVNNYSNGVIEIHNNLVDFTIGDVEVPKRASVTYVELLKDEEGDVFARQTISDSGSGDVTLNETLSINGRIGEQEFTISYKKMRVRSGISPARDFKQEDR